MTIHLTAGIERGDESCVALCPELDIANHGNTVESAKEHLAEALELFFESASPEKLGARLKDEVYVASVKVTFEQPSHLHNRHPHSLSHERAMQ